MTAVGLDLGGSKIEAQIFDADWALTDKRRVDTPQNYHALLNAIGDLVAWSKADQAQCSDWNWRRRGAVGGWARADCEFTSNKLQDCA